MHFSGDERGQAAAVGAAILLVFAIIGLGIAQIVVVPHQNSQVEFDHNELAQGDVQELRRAIIDSTETGRSQTSTITLGTQYPERVILQNPANPTGGLRIERLGTASVSNATALNSETADFWTGSTRGGYPNSIVSYSPNYNYFTSAPDTDYENLVVYNEQPDAGEHVVKANQQLLDGNVIRLALLDGSESVTKTGTATLEPRTLSASTNTVAIRSQTRTDPVVIRVPTDLPEEEWREMLAEERVERGGHLLGMSVDQGVLVLALESSVDYDLNMAKIGYEGSVDEPAAYITTPNPVQNVFEGSSTRITVEARDRYNNPVSGVDLRVNQPQVGSVTGPRRTATGTVVATSNEDGQATFTYHAPLNAPPEEALSTIDIDAPGIAGPKGDVTFEIGVRNTAEAVDTSRTSPIITAVEPAPSAPELTSSADGEFVRLSIRQPVNTTDWTLDLENRDRSVVNRLDLDRENILVEDESTEIGSIYGEGTIDTQFVDLNTITDRERVDLYFVGPTVTNASGFVTNNSLDENDITDVVIEAEAVSVENLLDASDGDPIDPTDPSLAPDEQGILDDRRGMVLLRDSAGSIADEFAYRSGGSGRITTVSASAGGDSAQEYARLDFARLTNLDNRKLLIESHGVREALDLDPFGELAGPVYIVGASVNKTSFADEHGVSERRVRYAGDLPGDLTHPEDVYGDDEAELELRNSTDQETLDTFEYENRQAGAIADVSPDGDDSADEYARLQFTERVDTTGWDLVVDNRSDGIDTLDLSAVSDVTENAPGPIYVVGSSVDVGSFAATKGVTVDRVVRAQDIVEGSLTDDDVFDDDGGDLTLRDLPGDAVDTFAYDSDHTLADPAPLSGEIEDVSPIAGGDENAEYTRLGFDQLTDTTDWSLRVTTRGEAVGSFDLKTVETFDLSGFSSTTQTAPGPIYLVGESIDPADFAADRQVTSDRVAQFGDENVLPKEGAFLELVTDNGTVVDTAAYGSEARPNIDWQFDLGPDATNQTAYRRQDTNQDYVDTDQVTDWFTSTLDPGLDLSPAAGRIEYVDDSVTTDDGSLGLDVVNRGETVFDRVEIVGFATDTHLAVALNNGAAAEAFVASEPTPAWGNDTDGKFAADGSRYFFEEGGSDWDGENGVLNGSGTTAGVDLEKYRNVDGGVAALGTLTESTPEAADLTVTLLFSDGSEETIYFEREPADLGVNMTANRTVVKPGEDVRFTVNLTNNGPGDAPGLVEVTDKLPRGLEYVADSPTNGTYSPATGEWQLPDGIDVGETETLLLDATVNVSIGESVTNVADITETTVPDREPANNQDSVTVTSGGADLGVNVTVNRTLVEQGERVAFDVTLTNFGPANNSGPIEVTDRLPDGLYYVDDEPSAGSYDPDSGVWTLPDGLDVNESETLTLIAKVSLSEPTANAANITDVGPVADGNLGNNTDSSDEIHVGPCSSFVEPDEEVLLYSTFETNGSSDAERLTNAGWSEDGPGDGGVNDMTSAPPDTEVCSQSAYHADGTGAINSPTLDTTGHDQVGLAYWIRPGSTDFESTLEGSAGEMSVEPNGDLLVQYRNATGAWVTVDRFDDDNSTLDGGVDRSTVIPLADATHEGFMLRFKQAQADSGGEPTGYWHVDNAQVLGSPSSGDLSPTVVNVEDNGDGTFTATFGYESTYDRPVFIPEGMAGMNEITPDTYADAAQPSRFDPGTNDSAVVIPDLAAEDSVTWTLAGESATAYGLVSDLGVDLSVDDDSVIEGQRLTFTTELTNQGPADNPGPIEVTASFPVPNQSASRLEFVGADATAGTYDADSGVWTLPDGLADGQSEALAVEVEVNTSEETTSSAAVTSTPTADSNPDNDRDELTIDPFPVDCGPVAFVSGSDENTIMTVDPAGTVRALGTDPDGIRVLGPHADVDDDGECEVVYVSPGPDGDEPADIRVMQFDETEGSGSVEILVQNESDLSRTSLAVGDVDGDGKLSVFYATDKNPDQHLRRIEYGSQTPETVGDGFETDSGGVGYQDITGDGVSDTIYIASTQQFGYLDGSTGTLTNVSYDGEPPGVSQTHGWAIGAPRPFGEAPSRFPFANDGGLSLVDVNGTIERIYTGGDVAVARVAPRDWDRDGEWDIVYVTPNGQLRVLDIADSEISIVTDRGEASSGHGVQ